MALWYSVLLCAFTQDFVMASLSICTQPCPAWTGTGPRPFGCLHAPWGHRMAAAQCDKQIQSAHVWFSALVCLCRLLPGRQTYVIDKKGKVALSFNDQVSVALLMAASCHKHPYMGSLLLSPAPLLKAQHSSGRCGRCALSKMCIHYLAEGCWKRHS